MIERRVHGLLPIITFYYFAVAICAFATPVQAWAQSNYPHRIRISVDTILATNTGKGMDKKLDKSIIGERLRELFEYTTYRLVLHQEKETECGEMVTFEMPGGRILHIGPSSVLDNMVSMEVVLFQGPRPEMTTDLKIMNHAMLVVGGPSYQQGMLIEMISTDAPDRPAMPGLPPEALPQGPAPGPPFAGPIPADSRASPQH